MKIVNWRLTSFLFCVISISQFFVLTTVSMLFYPGGTLIDSNSSGYSFFSNFFSDLGRTKSLSGQSNLISCIIYMITCSILAISLIPFSIAFSLFFKGNKFQNILSYAIMCLGILTGTFMIATVLTAWDIYKNTHLVLGIIYTIFWVIMIFLIAIAIINNKSFPMSYAVILIIYFIVALFNLLIVTILHYEPINETSLIIQVTIQKLTVYSTLICFLILGLKALELEKKRIF